MSRFEVTDTPLAGLKLVRRQKLGDSRGFLSRLFCADELAAAGWSGPIAQINHTFTGRAGTVRGMHFQRPPHAEAKLVSCLRGEVWDVAVDLRAGSATFLRWHAERLSADNGCALLIPPGFAHGFQALSDDVELLYCHSTAYAAQSEAGLHPQDERLGIAWPLAIAELSARDTAHPRINETFTGFAP
jgi:dTDP-4-dehydrorhamnose 3,5-epimerase